jgi:hypothetical protein
MVSRPELSPARRVEGVQVAAFVAKGYDVSGYRVGGFSCGMSASFSHDVCDVPLSLFRGWVGDRIPDTIASSPDGQILRLYVPVSNRGQINDIGLLNGVYKAPGRYPYVPRSGGKIYTAPADEPRIRSQFPSRQPARPAPLPGTQDWIPGPGDRFNVVELP